MNIATKAANPAAGLAIIAEELGRIFASRAQAADESDSFVGENYKLLKSSGLGGPPERKTLT